MKATQPAIHNTKSHSGPALSLPRERLLLFLFAALTLAAIPVWIRFNKPAWDTAIYFKAVQSIQIGHDPYADGIAAQQLAHSLGHGVPSQDGPFSYVYSPITLPVLHLVSILPMWFAAAIYWLCYAAGVLGELWFGIQAFTTRERRSLLYLAPVAIFFPGMLASDTILSGNVAFMLYGAALAAAILAWRTSRWRWFYLAVLAASCVKAPLLSLLAIPVLSARRQWLPAGLTAVAGVALFAAQPLLWPDLFRHYLQAVELQFSYNRDFGFSLAGLFSGVLWDHHIPYFPASSIFYLAYAVPLFALLFFLSRRYLRGDFPLAQWAPVLLVGVILLNPRLIEYDAAPLALPLLIIFWRFFAGLSSRRAILYFAAFFLAANLIAFTNWHTWKIVEGILLVLGLTAGVWNLRHTPSIPTPTNS